jgi:hypothetical protein
MMGKLSRGSTLLLVAGMCSLLTVPVAIAADHYVAAGGNIQSAITSASNGDTVWLAAGTYTLNTGLDFGFKAITVRSQSGDPSDTIVDGQNRYRGFHLRNGFARVIGVTVRNGYAPPSDNGYRYGGGIYCEGGGIVSNCFVQNCSADYGGGIRIHSLGLVQNSVIRDNTSEAGLGDGGGGGIHIYVGGEVYDSQIYNNVAADSGGGVKLSHGGVLERCAVYNNAATRYGGGVYCFEGGTVNQGTIYNNTANYGGGLRLFRETGTVPVVSRCTIYGNETTTGNGGGIHLAYSGTIENCLLYDNVAASRGGGVYLYEGGLVHSCTIADNNTKDTDSPPDGVGDGQGGGIYTTGKATIRNSIIFWNLSESSENHNPENSTDRYEYCLTYPKPSGTGNLFGIPNFVDTSARNYYLRAQSVCIDAGGTTAAPDTDLLGIPRPLDGTFGDGLTTRVYDMGAYEYGYLEVDDFDGDGMPTGWEDANGLDSTDPADGSRTNGLSAVTDPDGDNLLNIEEFENGTNPQVADTDGDGIGDGAEVFGLYQAGTITEPDNSDTDGDGFNDKLEIDNDSDPNSASSYLTTLSGTVTYSGSVQVGQVVVVVSNASVAARTVVISGPGAYTVQTLPTREDLTVIAYRDSDGDLERDSWEAFGTYAGNPVNMSGATTGIDITLDDPTTDTDADGLTDFFEVYTSGTDHTNWDTDGDLMADGWEWTYRPTVNPTNSGDWNIDAELPIGDGLINREEYNARTHPNNADTDGDGMGDGWEWTYRPAVDPTNGLDGAGDPDFDQLANSNEFTVGTNPNIPDTDLDGMPDGWEAQYVPHLSPTNNDADAGVITIDFDGMRNLDEYQKGSDPTNPDTDGDGMPDGWEFTYPLACHPTNPADATVDYEPDGLNNADEYVWGTNPQVADYDGDGISDGEEVANGSDPTDPDSFLASISGSLSYSGIQTGVYYAVATQVPSPAGLVYRTGAMTNAAAYSIDSVAILTNYVVHAFLDSNGNASQDVWEATGQYETSGIPAVIYLTNGYAGVDITLEDDLVADFDGDGLPNMAEVYVHGTDPLLWDTDGDSMPDGWEVTYTNACNPTNPADATFDYEPDGLVNSNEYVHNTNPELSDTDGDGLHDQAEVDIHNTQPDNADSDGDGLSDGDEVNVHGTDPNNGDHDGDGFSDGEEVNVGSDPKDNTSFPATISGALTYTNGLSGTLYAIASDGVTAWTNAIASPGAYAITNLPTLTNYVVSAYRDSNGNSTQDTWEAQGTYTNNPVALTDVMTNVNIVLTHPKVDTDGDGLTDYDEVNLHSTDPTLWDTDGDSMPDGWEVAYSNACSPTNAADATADYEPDGLVNSNEYVLGTNPELADTDGDSMPDGWEAGYTNALSPTNGADGSVDYAGEQPAPDGLVNSNEFVYGTNPELWDTDGDGVSDGDEVNAGSDPTNAASYLVSIAGSVTYTGAQTGPVYTLISRALGVASNTVVLAGTTGPYAFTNLDTLLDYTITGFRDSNTNGVRDTWEPWGQYTNNPISQPTSSVANVDFDLADPTQLDSDNDGLSDMDEHYIYLTDPQAWDTDGDNMPDGWEVANSNAVDVLVADGTDDFDADGLVNSNEYNASTDPTNTDSDGDSMWDGWEWTYRPAVNPTNGLDGSSDPDGDNLSNSNEFVWTTDPNLPDSDGDSIPDGWETIYTNAVHPTNGADGAEDWIGEVGGQDGLVNSNEYQWGTNPELFDSDGDGAGDGLEVTVGTSPTNSDFYPVNVTGQVVNATVPTVTGQTYVVVGLTSNGSEFGSVDLGVLGAGFQTFTISNMPNRTAYWIWSYMDINSNATYETFEPRGQAGASVYPVTPTNGVHIGIISVLDSVLDTDGDGLSDYEEQYTYFTSITNADTDADGFSDSNEVHNTWATVPTNAASFPASIGGLLTYNGTVSGSIITVVSNSLLVTSNGPYAKGETYATPTNLPTLTNYYVTAYIDENSNSVMDVWEPFGTTETHPFTLTGSVSDANILLTDPSGDTDGDGLTDYQEYFQYFTNPYTNDTDGDTMLDLWEAGYIPTLSPTNGADWNEDPDGDLLTNILEHANNTDPTNPDTDGDGATDYEEVIVLGSDPLDPDTDNDGMPDGWEALYTPDLDPLVYDAFDDPDGDGLLNYQEYDESKTDPTNSDTDGEGLSDYEEYVKYSTIPTNTDTDADGFTDYDEIINIGSMATNSFDPRVVDDDDDDDPVPGDPNNNDYYEENGTLSYPYDSIQEAVNTAPDGYVVLVLDGTYKSTGNRDIDPGGKAITIRSRNGYGATKIENGFGGGFVCSTGEGSNTVIRGFTIRTSVIDLGSAGVTCDGSSPTITECRFYDCGEAGVLARDGAQPLVQDCIFEENQGGVKIDSSDARVERCTMWLNRDADGGGMWISGTSSPHIVNCLIVQNVATNRGGGVYVGEDATPIFVNTTIADNSATNSGGGIFNAGSMHFWNGILWGNAAADGPGFSLDHAFDTGYSCMQTEHAGGLNNIPDDPLFVGGGDYTLQSASPCIDKGSSRQAGIDAPDDDRDSNSRPVRIHFGLEYPSGYDMGAYEYRSGGTIALQAPGGTPNEVLIGAVPYEIEWSVDGSVGTNVLLEYTYDALISSQTWFTISASAPSGTNGGSFEWTVPDVITNRCYVRITDATNSAVADVSTFPFSITNGFKLLSPNGDQTFYAGQTVDVSWASSTTTNSAVDLVLSTDGTVFEVASGAVAIATGIPHTNGGATNSTNWVIAADNPDILTTSGWVRVTAEDGMMRDTSDSAFSVLGLIVSQPGSGSNVNTGSIIEVRWYTVGAGASVDIDLSTNAGVSYASLKNAHPSVDGSNTYSWTVGNSPTSNAVLRISSLSDTNVVGYSGVFKIVDGIAVTGESDLDGDGLPDGYEQQVGLDHQSDTGDSGAGGDPDGDGFDNRSEMLAGTDPLDGASWIGILSLSTSGSGGGYQPSADGTVPTIRWSAVVGRDYRIEAASSPMGPWVDASGTITADNAVMVWSGSSSAKPPVFFRIVALP